MAAGYPIPAARHRAEIVAVRSRFIATADHTPTVAGARAFLAEIRREIPDATHHVHAFAVGHGGTVTHGMSDDGEPPGTAGRPTLAVVMGSGLGDVCVVTARYFGGTKLGTGGLVKAYTEAAQAVLAAVPRAIKEERRTARLAVPYPLYETCLRLVAAHGGTVAAQDFGADVALTADFPADRVEALATALADATSGQVVLGLVGDR